MIVTWFSMQVSIPYESLLHVYALTLNTSMSLNFAVKVLVFLTMPIEPSSNDVSQQIEYLWGLKSSITCSNIVAVIVSLLESPLENLER